MPDEVRAPAPVERRVAALEQASEERNLVPAGFIDDFAHIAQEDWVPANAPGSSPAPGPIRISSGVCWKTARRLSPSSASPCPSITGIWSC